MIWRKLLFVLALAGVIKANAAYDASDVVKAYVGASVKYDSNLYRRSGSAGDRSAGLPAKADTIVEPRAGLKIDKMVSLQQLGLDLNVHTHRYSNSDYINYTGWRNSVYWNWAAGKRISGLVRYSDNKALSGFDDVIAVPDNCPRINSGSGGNGYIVDTYRDKRLELNAAWVLGHNYRLSGGVARTDNSHSQRACLDQVQTGYQASFAYVSDFGSEVAVYGGRTEIDYKLGQEILVSRPGGIVEPYAVDADDRAYQQDELGLTLKWKYSPKTDVSLRWGQSRLEFASGGRGPATWVGNATAVWRPSLKSTLTASYERMLESGTDRVGRSLLDAYTLRYDWTASVRTAMYLNGRYLQRDYDAASTQSDAGLVGRKDKDVGLEGGVIWRPMPALNVTSFVNFLKRDANVARADYVATIVGVTSQWWF